MEGYELAFIIGGLFLSLSVFSLILGDNYLFRLGSAIVSGAVSAYICVLLAEHYFYPLIHGLVEGSASLSPAQILRAAAVTIGILLLFCKAYTGSKTGGKAVLTVLTVTSAAILILGAAGGTIPAFIRTLAAQFRISFLPAEERGDIWYWLKTGTVTISAIAALLYTRHYSFGKKQSDGGNGSLLGNVLIGFTFGAITAAIFLTAANILVNHIGEILSALRSITK